MYNNQMGILDDHYYSIVCVANEMALDGNQEAMTDSNHPRVFLWHYAPHAKNHHVFFLLLPSSLFLLILLISSHLLLFVSL